MKKLAVAAAMVGLASSLLLSGGANASQNIEGSTVKATELLANKGPVAVSMKYITATEAKEIALNEVNGTVVDIDFDREGRYVFYEIELRTETEEIDVEVNAVTGELIVTERERLRKVGVKPGDKLNTSSDSAAEAVVKPVKKPGNKQEESTYITKQQAIEIAKKRVGNKANVTDIEREGNRYKVELKRGKFEYEVKINALTGKIVKVEIERD